MLAERLVFENELEVLETKEGIARNLFIKGLSDEDVADATKLPIERVWKLRKQETYAV